METTMQPVVEVVREMNRTLSEEHGWVKASPYEISTPDARIWLGSTYVSGEYTVHASHREKGFGVARGNVRVRITPALLQHHPTLGVLLAADLADAQRVVDEDGFDALVWPPPVWSQLSVQGVVDHR